MKYIISKLCYIQYMITLLIVLTLLHEPYNLRALYCLNHGYHHTSSKSKLKHFLNFFGALSNCQFSFFQLCDSKSCHSITLLHFLSLFCILVHGFFFVLLYSPHIIFKSNQENKQRTDTKNEIEITLQEAIERSQILLSQYWKNGQYHYYFAFLVLKYYFRLLYINCINIHTWKKIDNYFPIDSD